MLLDFRAAFLSLILCSGLATSVQSQDDLAELRSNLPKSSTQVFVLKNITSHIENVLKSKALGRVFENAGVVPIEALQREFEISRQAFFPTDIAIAANDESIRQSTKLFKLFYLFNMAIACKIDGKGIPEEDIDPILMDLNQQIDGLEIPQMTILVNFERGSQMVFTGIIGLLTSLEGIELQVKDGGKSGQVEFQIKDVVDPVEIRVWPSILGIDDEDHPGAQVFAEKLLQQKVRLKVTRLKKGIRLVIGPEPKQFGYDDKGFIESVSQVSNKLFATAWDNRVLNEVGEDLEKWIRRWNNSKFGKAFKEVDFNDAADAMYSVTKDLMNITSRGSGAGWAVGNQFRVKLDMVDSTTRTKLNKHEILKFIPADIDSYALSGLAGLGTGIANSIYSFETRLDLLEFRARSPAQADLYANLVEAYYANFKQVRDLIFDDFQEEFYPVAGYLFDAKGSADIELKFQDFKHSGTVSLIQIAVIGKPKNQDEIKKIMERIWFSLLRSVAKATDMGNDLPIRFKDDKVGRTPVRSLDFDFLGKSLNATIKVQGDFSPNYFMKDGYLIISSSKTLSKRILDSESRMSISDENIVDSFKFTGNLFAQSVGMYGEAVKFSFGNDLPLRIEELVETFDAAKELALLLNAAKSRSIQTGRTRQTFYKFEFASGDDF